MTYRSSISGQFVTKAYARRHPKTTQEIGNRKPKPKNRKKRR